MVYWLHAMVKNQESVIFRLFYKSRIFRQDKDLKLAKKMVLQCLHFFKTGL